MRNKVRPTDNNTVMGEPMQTDVKLFSVAVVFWPLQAFPLVLVCLKMDRIYLKFYNGKNGQTIMKETPFSYFMGEKYCLYWSSKIIPKKIHVFIEFYT